MLSFLYLTWLWEQWLASIWLEELWFAGDRGGSYGGDGKPEIVKQTDTVFIQGLSEEVTVADLQGHFGGIGLIKVCSF